LLYYGFPHVPLAVLAGFLAGQERHVHILEQDRDNGGRFAWRNADGPFPPLEFSPQAGASGSAAMVRLSLSAEVRLPVCHAVLAPEEVKLDLHLRLAESYRGAVLSERQARAYAAEIRRRLDQHICGNPEVTSVHIFAAAPVSIAFLLGQATAASGLPDCYVYNFDSDDAPRYKWSLSLRDAKAGRGGIRIF
jgi:hypothetical protein